VEKRRRVFENRAMKIFGPKREKVTGEWRRLHKEELCASVLLTKHYPGDQIKKNEMGGARDRYGK
jgi:hypothetical protein